MELFDEHLDLDWDSLTIDETELLLQFVHHSLNLVVVHLWHDWVEILPVLHTLLDFVDLTFESMILLKIFFFTRCVKLVEDATHMPLDVSLLIS